MKPFYRRKYTIEDNEVDRFDRLRPEMLLFYTQDVASHHSDLLGTGYQQLSKLGLFWAVTRHRVQVERMPLSGETITVETWPMPTTRVAYPRATVAYDQKGNVLFRVISLWVLMHSDSRAMILPGKSGIAVAGQLLGTELAVPSSIAPKVLKNQDPRRVRFGDLDRNGHMNNCQYLEWAADLLPGAFHKNHQLKELTVCYLSEARESETLYQNWELDADGIFQVETVRKNEPSSTGHSRVCALQARFETVLW